MDITTFNWVDYTILVIVGISTLISFARGFIREAVSLATWALAIWLAYKYGHDFGQNVFTFLTNDQARTWVGAGVIFFAILIAGALINFALGHFVFFSGLSAIDRILGMAFGFARGILLVAVMLLTGEIMQSDQTPWWKQSHIIPQFTNLTGWLKGFVPKQFERLKEKEAVAQKAAASQKPAVPATPAPVTTQPRSPLESVLPQATELAKQSMNSAMRGQPQVAPVPAPVPQNDAPAIIPTAPAPATAPNTTSTTTKQNYY